MNREVKNNHINPDLAVLTAASDGGQRNRSDMKQIYDHIRKWTSSAMKKPDLVCSGGL